MLNGKERRRWGMLLGLSAVTVGLLVLQVNAAWSPLVHELAEIGILLFAFAAIAIWTAAESCRIAMEDAERWVSHWERLESGATEADLLPDAAHQERASLRNRPVRDSRAGSPARPADEHGELKGPAVGHAHGVR